MSPEERIAEAISDMVHTTGKSDEAADMFRAFADLIATWEWRRCAKIVIRYRDRAIGLSKVQGNSEFTVEIRVGGGKLREIEFNDKERIA